MTGRGSSQPAQILHSVRETRSCGTLYLVLSIAANTKYSINSFFTPVFWLLLPSENRAQKPPLRPAVHPPRRMVTKRILLIEGPGLKTLAPCRSCSVETINDMAPDSVKGWFMTDLWTLDVVCGACGKWGHVVNAGIPAG
ncbi:hypothetical protein [Mycoplana rhizolycopersici]|jgi:hypothetical protein|uniref:Uncharacterized protein n=1 Tax=Mycoplana rhizolycopersici TaxID=2746702 RepID=A0ABX2QM95_9HYPH|nr:hypothetical protein [Rhizobium rhizolycopersici]NVP58024.1 hypothetical protein [Rhizobium rhizolycopersici]